jgi:hypothetical protein
MNSYSFAGIGFNFLHNNKTLVHVMETLIGIVFGDFDANLNEEFLPQLVNHFST